MANPNFNRDGLTVLTRAQALAGERGDEYVSTEVLLVGELHVINASDTHALVHGEGRMGTGGVVKHHCIWLREVLDLIGIT